MTIDECFQAIDKGEGLFFYPDDIKEILQRFALEFVEASVGVKQKCTHQDPQFCKDVKCPKIKWNACREQTLEAARKILGL